MSAGTENGSVEPEIFKGNPDNQIATLPIIERLEALGVSRGSRRWAAFLMAKWLWRPGGKCCESRKAMADEFSCGPNGYRRVARWESELRKSGVFEATSTPGKTRSIALAQGSTDLGSYGPCPPGTLSAQGSTDPEIRAQGTLHTKDTQYLPKEEGGSAPSPALDAPPDWASEVPSEASVDPAASQAPSRAGRRKPAETAAQVASRPAYRDFLGEPKAKAAWNEWLAWTHSAGVKAPIPRGAQAAKILNAGMSAGVEAFQAAVDYAIGGDYRQPCYQNRTMPTNGKSSPASGDDPYTTEAITRSREGAPA